MIVADLPQYKTTRAKVHRLYLEIDELTMTLDRHDAEYHNKGIPTAQAVLSTLKASRSAKRFELRKLEIELSDMKEAFRIKGQNDLLDNLIAVDGEPAAWQIKFKDEHGTQRSVTYTHNAIGDYRQIDPDAICDPLYTSPQAIANQSFDEWQKNPYTLVLQKSIDEDY